MIEEMLVKIREAEKETDKRKADAIEKADGIRFSADKRASEIIEGAKKNAKAERSNIITGAEMKSEEEYDNALADAKRRGEELKLSLDKKVEELAIGIAEELKNGGGY